MKQTKPITTEKTPADANPIVSQEVKNAIVEKRGRGRPPRDDFGQEMVESGDNSRYLRHALGSFNLPVVNTDDNKAVRERIEWYFNHCVDDDMKPTVTGLSNALGISRKTLHAWAVGDRRPNDPDRMPIIQQAYNILSELWEDYMLNGKINPVSGIFIGKNHFDYADKSEITLRPENPLGAIENPNDVQNRYIESTVDDGED